MAVFYPSFNDFNRARVRAASNLTSLERVLNFNSAANKSRGDLQPGGTPIIPPTPTTTLAQTSTITPTPSITPTYTPTPTPSYTPTQTPTPGLSLTPTPSITSTITPTPYVTGTPPVSPTLAITNTPTPSQTSTPTPTNTLTPSITPTITITPTIPLNVLYSASYIPLEVTNIGMSYNISQIGTGNPSLTCFRGTNYDFIVLTPSHPFTLRISSGDTSSSVDGAYNNNVASGITSGRVMFTPNSATPNTIYYQCAIHSGMLGTISIKDYQ